MMYAWVRRMIDAVGAAAGLVVFTPLLAVISLCIRLDSPGPVIFRQRRIGKDGKAFTFYKFRTMCTDTDPYGFSPRDASDPRVTRVGGVLRKTSLDELPQLFNVLQGQMSFVGPRPLLPWQYAQWTDDQRRRCRVKPGLTGWAQVHGRAALAHEDKIDLDIWYVDHASLMLDVKIVVQTVLQTIRGKDILEVRYSRDDPPGGTTMSNNSRKS